MVDNQHALSWVINEIQPCRCRSKPIAPSVSPPKTPERPPEPVLTANLKKLTKQVAPKHKLAGVRSVAAKAAGLTFGRPRSKTGYPKSSATRSSRSSQMDAMPRRASHDATVHDNVSPDVEMHQVYESTSSSMHLANLPTIDTLMCTRW